MILRQSHVKPVQVNGSEIREEARFGEVGKLTQIGANVVTLYPGERSSDRHWHANSDEFLYMIEGVATIIENDGPSELMPGDCACWPAGVANAHTVENRTTAPIRFLVVGTNPAEDRIHYLDSNQTLHLEAETWRMEANDGTVVERGKR